VLHARVLAQGEHYLFGRATISRVRRVDALIALAREVQRLFHRFTEENLKEYRGAEGKTISMSCAGAGNLRPLAAVYRGSGRNLDLLSRRTRIASTSWAEFLEWRRLIRTPRS